MSLPDAEDSLDSFGLNEILNDLRWRRGLLFKARSTASGFIRVNLAAVRVDARTELVIAADIAERLHLSRARVSVLSTRPDFPRPVGRLGRSDVWRWASVERWARDTRRLISAE
jgi:hypothetical protein